LSHHGLLIAASIVILTAAGVVVLLWLYRETPGSREARIIRAALANQRPGEAAKAVEHWLRISPQSAEAHFYKAQIAWVQGKLATAHEELVRARSLGYPREGLARLHGLLLARSGQTTQAEPLLRGTFERARADDPEVAESLSQLYLGAFRLGDAALILDRWSWRAPHDARPYLLRTEIDLRTGVLPKDVIAHYRAALERDPKLPKARLGLAEQLRLNHRCAEAAPEYTRYLEYNPYDPLGYLGAGQNALELSDDGEAVRLLDRALALAPHDTVALAARATVEVRRGCFEAALRYLNQAVKHDPFDFAIRYQRAVVLGRLGRTAEADAERKAMEHARSDQMRFAQLSRDLRRTPLDPQLRSDAACWLMTHGHEQEAVDWANLVLQTEPFHPTMNRLLADYYRREGQVGLANFYEANAGGTSP
jgi:Flp pilus assembly protein TadD